jgi:hypothetical protein
MRYEVVSRHKKGFLLQYLVVPADNPDDACVAAYETWDMDERVITRIRLMPLSEIDSIKNERRLLTMSTVFAVVAVVGFVSLFFI